MLLLRRVVWSVIAQIGVTRAALLLAPIAFGGLCLAALSAAACPFCAAVSLTFCEEIAGADAAVIAKLVKPAPPVSANNPTDVGKAQFEIVERLKGDKSLAVGKKLEVIYFGDSPVGTLMLITGVDPANLNWSTPIAISPKARDYLAKALKLPKEGAERLVFFQDYLEDSDELLARDAYDEFAKTPYAGVKELKGHIHHDKLLAWIQDPKIAPSRRRLYLTMLAVCGQPDDSVLLEKMIRSDDRQVKSGLDALIAAYLTLKGSDGVPLVEDLFLKKQDADYAETYAAIMALRFHGQEETAVPRARLLEALHFMLDRPQLADLVIADLARWQDWAVMDRLVTLFKNATDETSWVRVPVINYLQACPLPKAKDYLAELAKLDPDSMKKATNLFPAATARDKSANAPADDKKAGSDKPPVDKDAAKKDGEKDDSASAPRPPVKSQSAIETRGPRLSRSAAPEQSMDKPVGAPSALTWLAVASCLLGASFWAILGGGKKGA
ncbi:MAG TPA: hypothetical protein VMF30_07060 [Pirellulales bacterium]|nr:hypothetical protein [Pirellulales bacterium]